MLNDDSGVEQRGGRRDSLLARLTEAERRLLEAEASLATNTLDETSGLALASYLRRALHQIQEAKVLTSEASG